MVVYTSDFNFDTQEDFDVVDLKVRVEEVVGRSGVNEGMALVLTGHATGVLILNEADRALLEDLKGFLRRLLPVDGDYRNPGNTHTHLRLMLFTPSRVLPVHGGAWAWGPGRASTRSRGAPGGGESRSLLSESKKSRREASGGSASQYLIAESMIITEHHSKR
jgi:secondary thiamine-phosphate synthase enzyme